MSKNPLEVELSTRARRLLAETGGGEYADLVLPELSLASARQGTLMVERSDNGACIYMETPNGTTIRTSNDEILSWAVESLRRQMILDDLAEA